MQEALTTVRSRRPFTILGAVIALITLGAFAFLALRPQPAVIQQPVTGTAKLVVAAKDIPARVGITESDVKLVNWPVAGQPPGALTSLQDVLPFTKDGKTVDVNAAPIRYSVIAVKAGQPLLTNELVNNAGAASGAEPAFLQIPSGYVAMTIPSGEQTGVAGFVQPGDYIGIIATLVTINGTVAKTVFYHVKVIEVGTATYKASEGASGPVAITLQPGGGGASSLTVIINECDAEYLNWFLSRASLRYTLESYQDYPGGPPPGVSCAGIDRTTGVTSADVAKRYGLAITP